jgi:hypothetical protein
MELYFDKDPDNVRGDLATKDFQNSFEIFIFLLMNFIKEVDHWLVHFVMLSMVLCREVSTLNGTETLTHLLADPRDEAVANTCCVLTNMATEEVLRSEAQGKGIVTALLEPLKSQLV